MSDLKLTGQKVLLTRPAPQQQGLRKAIEAAGGTVLSLPLLQIGPNNDPQAALAARSAVQDLDHFQMLIFISTNAVEFGAELINDFWPQFPVDLDVIAIGATTAQNASTLLQCPVIRPEQGSDSEAVLALPQLQDVKDKRIAIFRGQGGRELLANTLRERGARVDYVEVYLREVTPVSAADLADRLFSGSCSAITVHSRETLDRLITLGADNIDRVTLIPLVVPSQRVAERAGQAGFADVVTANGADDESMLKALCRIAARTR